jgi:hypothetical protein
MHLTTRPELEDKPLDRATLDIFEPTPEMIKAGCKWLAPIWNLSDERDVLDFWWTMVEARRR